MARYRVLSLDGGGVRGVVTAIILERLQQKFPDLLADVGLMAGTSTGGLIALGLRAGMTPAQLRDLYLQRSDEIFDDNFLDDLLDLGKVAGADYSDKGRRKLFKQVLGADTRLQDLSGHVLIPAFDLDDSKGPDDDDEKKDKPDTLGVWKAKLFHNYEGGDTDGKRLAWKVAMYTTAAPTYFPSYDGYIDGGVYANNPCMCALAQTQDDAIGQRPAISDVRLLSLGTGVNRLRISQLKNDWGYAQWTPRILELMTDASMDVARYHCDKMLGDHFLRYAPYLKDHKKVALDAVDELGHLKSWAEAMDLTEVEQWVRLHWL